MVIYKNKEKKNLVIQLLQEGKTYPEIAKLARISPRDIGKIVDEYTGEEPQIEKSITAKAFELFMQNKTLAEVVIALNLEYDVAKPIYLQYLDSSKSQKSRKYLYRLRTPFAFDLTNCRCSHRRTLESKRI